MFCLLQAFTNFPNAVTADFDAFRSHLRNLADICDREFAGDYAINQPDKVVRILKIVAEERRAKPPVEGQPIEATVSNLVKVYIPVLQRVAAWQQYDLVGAGLTNNGEVEELKMKLDQEMAAAKKAINNDWAAMSR